MRNFKKYKEEKIQDIINKRLSGGSLVYAPYITTYTNPVINTLPSNSGSINNIYGTTTISPNYYNITTTGTSYIGGSNGYSITSNVGNYIPTSGYINSANIL